MYEYKLGTKKQPATSALTESATRVLLVSSEELEKGIRIPGLEDLLHHVPLSRDAHTCKAEPNRTYLSGTIVTPRYTRDKKSISFGFLIQSKCIILCDDSGAVHSMVQRIIRQDEGKDRGIGLFLYDFLELLIMKDPHHLMELEDRLEEMEEQNGIDHPEDFNRQMTAIRKEIIGWIRYYTQLSDVVCEFLENENSFFSEEEIRMLRLVDKRIERLQNEAVALREYAVQVRELFQSEISIRQNQIMKVLTIVTTILCPCR